MKIVAPVDCDNAPKKQILRDLGIAMAQSNTDEALKFVADDLEWITIGTDEVVSGSDQLAKKLRAASAQPISQLTIKKIITHGRDGAIEGEYLMGNGQTFAFCHICQFNGFAKSARVKYITSYIVKTNG